jgi:PPOX class probable F420-dependent enzyme
MTDEEVRGFLRSNKTIILNTNGPDGFPHPMPMWFAMADDGTISMATYKKSQKIKNLQRDPRVSILSESGKEYNELKGVVIYGHAEVIDDFEAVADAMIAAGGHESSELARSAVSKTAAKRFLIRVKPERIVSWDHSKLAGVY